MPANVCVHTCPPACLHTMACARACLVAPMQWTCASVQIQEKLEILPGKSLSQLQTLSRNTQTSSSRPRHLSLRSPQHRIPNLASPALHVNLQSTEQVYNLHVLCAPKPLKSSWVAPTAWKRGSDRKRPATAKPKPGGKGPLRRT